MRTGKKIQRDDVIEGIAEGLFRTFCSGSQMPDTDLFETVKAAISDPITRWLNAHTTEILDAIREGQRQK